ncbi:MAG TPA: hypothetical protein VL495_03275 [Edaphobacter sp.]|nr:hypothetical protein [Edaphobacter sp.]
MTADSERPAQSKKDEPAIPEIRPGALMQLHAKTFAGGKPKQGIAEAKAGSVRLLSASPTGSATKGMTGKTVTAPKEAKETEISTAGDLQIEEKTEQKAVPSELTFVLSKGREEESVGTSGAGETTAPAAGSANAPAQNAPAIHDAKGATLSEAVKGGALKIVPMPVKEKDLKAPDKSSASKKSEAKADKETQVTTVSTADAQLTPATGVVQGNVIAMSSPTGKEPTSEEKSSVSAVGAKAKTRPVELKKTDPQKTIEPQDGVKETGVEEEASGSVAREKKTDSGPSILREVKSEGVPPTGEQSVPGVHDSGRSHLEVVSAQAAPVPLHSISSPANEKVAQPSASLSNPQGHAALYATHEPASIAATPTSLEVGVSGGTHGWLKVRAELAGDGLVHASVSASSQGGTEMLRRELPALTSYLHQEQVGVSSVAVHAPSSTMNLSDMSSGGGPHREAGGSGADSQRGGAGQESASALDRTEESFQRTIPENRDEAGWSSSIGYAGAGGWLSVRA